MRERLPNRRVSQTIRVDSPFSSSVHYNVTIGFQGDERQPETLKPAEVFVSASRVGNAMAMAGIEIATLISIALQHGASLSELSTAMPRDDKGVPEGLGGAVLEAVIKEILA